MNLAEFHFIRPYWLLALLPYLVIIFLMIKSKLSQGNWNAVCDPALLPYLLESKPVRQSRWPLWSGAVAGLLAVLALAGPAWERLPAPVFRNDSALVIVLDLSRSMAAGDIKPSRLVMARYKISDILKQRKDGQTALLTYAGDAFTVTPLTTDTETIDNQLSALSPDIMPADGNNIGRALTKAVELFKQAGLQKGRILLVSDGGSLDEGIAEAKTLGDYQVSILGVGTAEGAPIAVPTGGFLKDDQGDIVIDKVDTAALEKLAQAGGGAYYALTPDDSDIRSLLGSLSEKLKGNEGQKKEKLFLEQWNDRGPWLLLAVLPLAALSFRKGILAVLFLVFIPMPKTGYALDLNWQDLWQTKDRRAQEAYKKGDYAKAAELFQNPQWKAAAQYKSGAYDKALENLKNGSSADNLYNKGNALAQSGQLQQALDAYNQALKLKPNDSDFLYNKELVEKELDKQKQQQQQNQQDQDNKDDQNQEQDKKDQKNQKDGQNKQPDQNPQSGDKYQNQQEQEQKQDQAEEKTDQKPEQSQEQLEKQAEQQKAEEEKERQNEQQQPEAAQQDSKKADEDNKSQAAQEAPMAQSKEEQQANEQWLNRIPDDPAGLLRRKFKYQYDRRGQP